MKLMKINIAGTEYHIKYVEKISDIVRKIDKIKLRTEILGLCYPKNGFWEPGKIVVKISENSDETANTIFHEISHALLTEMIYQHPEHKSKLNMLNKDENFVQNFSEALRDVVESFKTKRTTNGEEQKKACKERQKI